MDAATTPKTTTTTSTGAADNEHDDVDAPRPTQDEVTPLPSRNDARDDDDVGGDELHGEDGKDGSDTLLTLLSDVGGTDDDDEDEGDSDRRSSSSSGGGSHGDDNVDDVDATTPVDKHSCCAHDAAVARDAVQVQLSASPLPPQQSQLPPLPPPPPSSSSLSTRRHTKRKANWQSRMSNDLRLCCDAAACASRAVATQTALHGSLPALCGGVFECNNSSSSTAMGKTTRKCVVLECDRHVLAYGRVSRVYTARLHTVPYHPHRATSEDNFDMAVAVKVWYVSFAHVGGVRYFHARMHHLVHVSHPAIVRYYAFGLAPLTAAATAAAAATMAASTASASTTTATASSQALSSSPAAAAAASFASSLATASTSTSSLVLSSVNTDAGTASLRCAIVMEYARGGALDVLVKRSAGGLGEDDIRDMLHDIVPALRYMHETIGYVHNDIKPHNILLFDNDDDDDEDAEGGDAKHGGGAATASGSDEDATPSATTLLPRRRRRQQQQERDVPPTHSSSSPPSSSSSSSLPQAAHASSCSHCRRYRHKLVDFASADMAQSPAATLAQLRQPREQLLQQSAMLTVFTGTAAFMSPESCLGVTRHTGNDVWSLGVTVFYLATGRVPWYPLETSNPELILHGYRARFAAGLLFADVRGDDRAASATTATTATATTATAAVTTLDTHAPSSCSGGCMGSDTASNSSGSASNHSRNSASTSVFGPVLSELDERKHSSELVDFVRVCLTEHPLRRPSCAELMQHPFYVKKSHTT